MCKFTCKFSLLLLFIDIGNIEFQQIISTKIINIYDIIFVRCNKLVNDENRLFFFVLVDVTQQVIYFSYRWPMAFIMKLVDNLWFEDHLDWNQQQKKKSNFFFCWKWLFFINTNIKQVDHFHFVIDFVFIIFISFQFNSMSMIWTFYGFQTNKIQNRHWRVRKKLRDMQIFFPFFFFWPPISIIRNINLLFKEKKQTLRFMFSGLLNLSIE